MPQQFNEFADQSHRLLRQNWDSATALSQEIYAMLMSPVAPEHVQAPDGVQQRLQQARDRMEAPQRTLDGGGS